MDVKEILARLPYDKPFLFVDELLRVDEEGVEGTFLFREDLDFYNGHFRGHAVTPGVLLVETMAQIGVVSLGIFLLNNNLNEDGAVALTSVESEFLQPVYPGEKVTVVSKKIYFRFGKLKCHCVMKNEKDETVCKATIAGMIR